MPNISQQRMPPRLSDAKTQENQNVRDMAVLFADIVGSTALYERLGDRAAHQLVVSVLASMQQAIEACGGKVIKTIGDELLCTFTTADEAAIGAITIQKEFANRKQAGLEPVEIRIGVNYGPVVESADDVFGNSVNVAARLVSLASPRQILTTALFVDRLSSDHRNHARELQRVGIRGRSDYIAVWALLWRFDNEKSDLAFHARGQYQTNQLTLEFRGRSWELRKEGDFITLGRDETNHVLLDNPFSSRLHARIEIRNGKFVLIDLSTNGTFIRLDDGKLIAVMREELVLGEKGTIAFSTGPQTARELAKFSVHARNSARSEADLSIQLLSTSENHVSQLGQVPRPI